MQVPDPSDLQLKVVVMLMETTVARGASLVSQLRRSYVRIEHDELGRKVVRIKGNASTKTLQGYSEGYKPLDVVINGNFEVITFTLQHYPA